MWSNHRVLGLFSDCCCSVSDVGWRREIESGCMLVHASLSANPKGTAVVLAWSLPNKYNMLIVLKDKLGQGIRGVSQPKRFRGSQKHAEGLCFVIVLELTNCLGVARSQYARA